MDRERDSLIEAIQSSGFKACIVASGGGSGAVHALLSHAGASRFVLEAQIPYNRRALFDYLGEEVESACSEDAAATMAERAFERALVFTLSDESKPSILGIACTAALQTNRERRGADRACIAIKARHRELVRRIDLEPAGRAGQEDQLSRALLEIIAEFIEVPPK